MFLPPYFRGRYTLKSGPSLGNLHKSSLNCFTGAVAMDGPRQVGEGGLFEPRLLSP